MRGICGHRMLDCDCIRGAYESQNNLRLTRRMLQGVTVHLLPGVRGITQPDN